MCTLVLFIGLTCVSHGMASVEWEIGKTLQLEKPPMDVAVSPDGQWFFVLTDEGEVLIYTSEGQLKDRMAVGDGINGIQAGPRGDILFLTSRKNQTIQQITLGFAQEIDVSAAPFKGSVDGPVVIAVFNDFQCPYCARLLPVYKQVLERYPKAVKLVFKHFPLGNHRFAAMAALAALAAGRQGKFWEFHDRLFDNYNRLNEAKVQEIVRELNLNEEQFEKDMQDPDIVTTINDDLREGRKAGVRGTPAVFINGRLLRDKSFEGFQAMIEKELKRKVSRDG